MDPPAGRQLVSSLQHHHRRTYAERCKVGRALAAQWMSLSVVVGSSSAAPQAQSHAGGGPPMSHSTFLEALKKVPLSLSIGSSDAAQDAVLSDGTPHPTNHAVGSGSKISPLLAIDDCFQDGILSILREIALSGATLPDNPPSADAGTSAESRLSPASLDDPSPTNQLPTTPPLRPLASTATAKKVASAQSGALTSPSSLPIGVVGAPVNLIGSCSNGNNGVGRGGVRRPPLTPLKDPDMDHWKDIKEKLLHLRTQIRNRDEFDAGLVRFFGDEWSRTVRDGSVEDDGPLESSVTSMDGDRCSPSTLVSMAASVSRRTPGGTTAPPSPIGTQAEDSEVKDFSPGSSPPPPRTPPQLGGKPSTPTLAARNSPPPPPTSGSGAVGSSPVTSRVAGYHLESRDDMIRRRNNSIGGSMSSFNNSMTGGGGYTPKTMSTSNSPLMGPMLAGPGMPGLLAGLGSSLAPAATLCPFDYIMVIDFEATCDEPSPPNFLHEIIEFPVVVVDVQLRRVCMEFHSFVRPSVHPVLSHFCTQLTGIRQEDVDLAPALPEVIRRFEAWFKNAFPPQARVIFATDGPWDMRDFMYNHSHKRQGVQFPQVFYQWIDVKQAFANFFHTSRQRIVKMLEYLGLPFEGRLHSGIDDSRNIAKIVIGLLLRGCSLCDIDRIPYLGAPASIDGAPS